MRSTLLRLIFIMRIIEYKCKRKISEKSSFELATINLSIKLYLLTSQMLSQSFNLI